jgi:hypothetical protein
MRWVVEHPISALVILIVFLWSITITTRVSNKIPRQATTQASRVTSVDNAVVPAAAAYTSDSKEPAASTKPAVSVSGTYVGTVHNQTSNASSSVVVVLHQTKGGLLDGCMDVKFPLYGSGALLGSIQGTHLSFVVSNLTYQGDASKNEIAGSYGVSGPEEDHLGKFRLTKQKAAKASYECVNGALTSVATAESPSTSSGQASDAPRGSKVLPSNAKSHLPIRATVTGDYRYSTLYKRCAFLPSENYGRCGFGPEVVAELKRGDGVTVLSPLTRAENGQDIYKVRTDQGWVGWIDVQAVTLDPQ